MTSNGHSETVQKVRTTCTSNCTAEQVMLTVYVLLVWCLNKHTEVKTLQISFHVEVQSIVSQTFSKQELNIDQNEFTVYTVILEQKSKAFAVFK